VAEVTDGVFLRVRLVRRVGRGRSGDIFEPLPGELGDSVAPSGGVCSLGVLTPDDSVDETMSIEYERRLGMADIKRKNAAHQHASQYMIYHSRVVTPHVLRHVPA
jgi:hypothetical protein